jgi:hypothetical protein
MTAATTHITNSGGLISAAFIDNIRELDTRQPGAAPLAFRHGRRHPRPCSSFDNRSSRPTITRCPSCRMVSTAPTSTRPNPRNASHPAHAVIPTGTERTVVKRRNLYSHHPPTPYFLLPTPVVRDRPPRAPNQTFATRRVVFTPRRESNLRHKRI